MSLIANTPKPPYYAVIFTSVRTDVEDGYADMANLMVALAEQQDGYLGMETSRNEVGITVSYWRDLESIRTWKSHTDHNIAQKKGRTEWYSHYKIRIALVERDYFYEGVGSGE